MQEKFVSSSLSKLMKHEMHYNCKPITKFSIKAYISTTSNAKNSKISNHRISIVEDFSDGNSKQETKHKIDNKGKAATIKAPLFSKYQSIIYKYFLMCCFNVNRRRQQNKNNFLKVLFVLLSLIWLTDSITLVKCNLSTITIANRTVDRYKLIPISILVSASVPPIKQIEPNISRQQATLEFVTIATINAPTAAVPLADIDTPRIANQYHLNDSDLQQSEQQQQQPDNVQLNRLLQQQQQQKLLQKNNDAHETKRTENQLSNNHLKNGTIISSEKHYKNSRTPFTIRNETNVNYSFNNNINTIDTGQHITARGSKNQIKAAPITPNNIFSNIKIIKNSIIDYKNDAYSLPNQNNQRGYDDAEKLPIAKHALQSTSISTPNTIAGKNFKLPLKRLMDLLSTQQQNDSQIVISQKDDVINYAPKFFTSKFLVSPRIPNNTVGTNIKNKILNNNTISKINNKIQKNINYDANRKIYEYNSKLNSNKLTQNDKKSINNKNKVNINALVNLTFYPIYKNNTTTSNYLKSIENRNASIYDPSTITSTITSTIIKNNIYNKDINSFTPINNSLKLNSISANSYNPIKNNHQIEGEEFNNGSHYSNGIAHNGDSKHSKIHSKHIRSNFPFTTINTNHLSLIDIANNYNIADNNRQIQLYKQSNKHINQSYENNKETILAKNAAACFNCIYNTDSPFRKKFAKLSPVNDYYPAPLPSDRPVRRKSYQKHFNLDSVRNRVIRWKKTADRPVNNNQTKEDRFVMANHGISVRHEFGTRDSTLAKVATKIILDLHSVQRHENLRENANSDIDDNSDGVPYLADDDTKLMRKNDIYLNEYNESMSEAFTEQIPSESQIEKNLIGELESLPYGLNENAAESENSYLLKFESNNKNNNNNNNKKFQSNYLSYFKNISNTNLIKHPNFFDESTDIKKSYSNEKKSFNLTKKYSPNLIIKNYLKNTNHSVNISKSYYTKKINKTYFQTKQNNLPFMNNANSNKNNDNNIVNTYNPKDDNLNNNNKIKVLNFNKIKLNKRNNLNANSMIDNFAHTTNIIKYDNPNVENKTKTYSDEGTMNKMKNNTKKKKKKQKKNPKPKKLNSDLMRLESIKYQILTKLGLKQKPNITRTIPKHIIMSTLSRADENTNYNNNNNHIDRNIDFNLRQYYQHHHQQHHVNDVTYNDDNGDIGATDVMNGDENQVVSLSKLTYANQNSFNNVTITTIQPLREESMHDKLRTLHRQQQHHKEFYQPYQLPLRHQSQRNEEENSEIEDENHVNGYEDNYNDDGDDGDYESDDFYGRTREIIIFAEPGELLNHQRLIEFSAISDSSKSDAPTTTADTGQKSDKMTEDNDNYNNNIKLKPQTKCKSEQKTNQQRKRKRRRRRRKINNQTNQHNIDYASNYMEDDRSIDSKINVEKILLTTAAENYKNDGKMSPSTNPLTSNADQMQHESNTNADLRVRRAFLWIKIDAAAQNGDKKKQNTRQQERRGQSSSLRNKFTLWVFRIIEPYCKQSENRVDKELNQQTEMSVTKNLQMSKLGWQKLDVTSTVRQWYANGAKSRLKLLVDCSGCVDRVNIHLFNDNLSKTSSRNKKLNFKENGVEKLNERDAFVNPNSSNKIRNNTNNNSAPDTSRPFLVIYTDPNVMKRVRRRALDCSGAVRGQCCKQKFYVSFRELGWDDWIIAPHGYYANYCQGNCNGLRTPDNFRSYHSHVMEEYRKMNRLTGLQLCCTPLKFSSMSLIYYEENQKIIKRDLPKMVVDECGCP